MNKIPSILSLVVASFVASSVHIDSVTAQIQDLENLVEIQVWFTVDEHEGLARYKNPWSRGPFLVAAELISDPEFVAAALKLSQDESIKLNRYLKEYYRQQDEADQSVWHYPPPGFDRVGVYQKWLADARTAFETELSFLDTAIVANAYQRYLFVLLGFETVIQQPSLVPELKLTHQQQNELLAAIREERTASCKRAAEYHSELVEEIESILTEPQRQEFKRLYRDDVMNLHVLWELLLAQLQLEPDSSLIQLLRGDEPDLWLSIPNQWHYRVSGRLATEKFVSEHVTVPKVSRKDEANRCERDVLQRLLALLEDPRMSELLELSQQQNDEIAATRDRLTKLNTTNVARFELVKQEMIANNEIPEGPLDSETGNRVRGKFLKQTFETQMTELRPVRDLLVPRQRQQLETLQIKVETRAVGILSSFRWGQLGKSLQLSERQFEGLDKLRKIKLTQLGETLAKEEDLFWERLADLWTEEQTEMIGKIRHNAQEYFRPAPGLLLLESQGR
ncbi:MAG: hypothetical protein Q8M16_02715 [Pirellulaceae bacterium]|nr:hypothetical protein [Pirellulaceae bacterium]